MEPDPLVFSFFLIFTTAAILATVALFTRQPLIVAYIVVGAMLGPSGLSLVSDPELIRGISVTGIIFLLFLLGLDMQPAKLLSMLREATLVAISSSILFALLGFMVSSLFGFSFHECVVIGITMMFSSTIMGIKLLPTTVLHHRHTGEIVVSLLLIQDLIAIIALLVIGGGFLTAQDPSKIYQTLLALPLLIAFCLLFVKYVLFKLLARFDAFHEYIFLLAIGWCLGVAELARILGLSVEVGAFIAGISIATSPIALYIAGNLKPLRDFFLVLFFFSLGAGFQLHLLSQVLMPAIALGIVVLISKPIVFRVLLHNAGESVPLAWEIGFRLGQISEFSLLIAFIASSNMLISLEVSHLIQATTILTFLISSYIVVFKYPTPIAVSDALRRD
ncbi:MAG: cation:proton antiporter [Gammaproteobacteria bacterium]|nr:cation:proton antiporter [Gammaproteobacteria bacterium]